MPTPREVVDTYFSALAAGDFERLRSVLSDERFSTRSPIGAFDSADDYVLDISRVEPILEGIERRHTFVDGDLVCAVVNYVTRMDQRVVSPVVHLLRVEDGKVTSIETIFDARAYAEMFVE